MIRTSFLKLAIATLSLTSAMAAEHHVQLETSDSDRDIIAKAASLTPSRAQLLHHQDEFNGFIHFGPNTFTGVEWGNGKEDTKAFNPPEVDTDQWCRIMKAAGMRKVVITAKHHDGYCTWQTRYNKDFSIHQSPWKNGKGDVLKKLSDSCKKHGLKLGVYLSPADLYQIENASGLYGNLSKYQDSMIPTDPASFKSNPMKQRKVAKDLPTFKVSADDYNRYFMNQLYEVLTEYGPIHEVWFDGAHPKRKGGQTYIREEWFKMIRKLAPEAAIFGGPDVRWCGNEHGGTRKSEWNAITVDHLAVSGYDRPAQNIGTDQEILAKGYEVYGKKFKSNYLYYLISEVDVSIRHGWFWRNDTEQHVRDADDIFDMYERSVGGNAVFLLNVPPNNKGKFSARDEASLMEVGKRIKNTYGTNLAEGATSEVQGIFDGKLTTYWQPQQESGEFTVTLPKPQKINRILLQENIKTVGQRVKQHAVDAWINGQWKEISAATTIGYKRILRFPPVMTDRIRVRILESRFQPTIANFSAHYYQSPPLPVSITRNAKGQVTISINNSKHHQQDSGLTLHYTLDGSEPSEHSSVYTSPFQLPNGGIVKARSHDGEAFGPTASTRLGISQQGWKILSVSSEHDNQYAAAKAIDGNPKTFWHTSWSSNQTHPHHLTIDLGKVVDIAGITYLPRQDKRVPDSMIETGSVELSLNKKTWHSAGDFTFGNLLNDPSLRSVLFKKSGRARYLRFNTKTGAQGKPYAGAAEIQVLAK
ncbi:alpha-L-fucosidase [Verrucomicrobiaceae bacterium N1E253]|uniref:alpha-L-fucosidase n=1 Tax=Oceaniferula marina TaxID=2748318 RepID=A0A851GMR5_9BACT|nr:alpha-L-fucosidase [Oceaniferula marina]NWK57131.1 alpha-L-fucosidase [Oceaniferula marina]